MKNLFAKTLTAAALITSSVYATAALDFTVDPTVDPTITVFPAPFAPTAVFTANRVNGSYQEAVQVTSFNVGTQTGTFTADIYVNLTGFTEGNNLAIDNFITGLSVNYGLYALIEVSGNIDNTGASLNLNNFSGTIDLFADWDRDTTNGAFTQIGGGNGIGTNLANNGTDVLLGFASSISGSTNTSNTSSSFALDADDWTLTGTGSSYFIAPNPFYVNLESTGDVSSFLTNLNLGNLAGLQLFGDTASITFVPEPATLGILGLGIFGLAFAGRRKA